MLTIFPKWLLAVIVLACAWWGYQQFNRFEVNPAVIASQRMADPAQSSTQASTQTTANGDISYQITVLEHYEGQFRVLSRKNYRTGREAEFSPLDIAAGWDDMARPDIYNQVEIKQRNRWYYWRTEQPPISLQHIAEQSANMHLVPGNAQIAEQLNQIKQHDLLYIKGALIEVQGSDGWRWRSSLSRTDTGAGACEVMRVDEIRWL